MRIGLFYQIQVPKPWTAESESQRIYEALEQIPYAEQQGFESVWFSEHHFRPVWSHNSAPTSVSRAAQMAFTKALSQEGAPHNVLVNSLHVGVIVSDQIKRRYDRERPNVSFEQYVAEVGKGVPLGRMGRAEEFANVATFLASDAAGYVTGCAINVDGGRSPVV